MLAGVAVGSLCIASTGVAFAADASDTKAQTTTPAAQTPADSGPTAKPATRRLMVGGRKLHSVAGKNVIVKGRGTPGKVVRLQVRSDRRWRTIGKGRVSRDQTYRVKGSMAVPLSGKGRVVSNSQKRRVGRINIYRYAQASWYGPGLYGGHLACGGTLTPGTMGVAHKYLPCGTKVTIRKGSKTVRVPVVDRGPYVGGREYDLTAAVAQRINFGGVGTILATH